MHQIQKLGTNLKKDESNLPKFRDTQKVLHSRTKPQSEIRELGSLVLQWKHNNYSVFVAILWTHVSIFDAWPRLAFQMLPMPMNTTAFQTKNGESCRIGFLLFSVGQCRFSFFFVFSFCFSLVIGLSLIQRRERKRFCNRE